MSIVIFNKHQEYDASWCHELVYVMRPSILENPSPIGGRVTRPMAIENFRSHLKVSMQSDTPQRREIRRLAKLHQEGKDIG